MRGLCFCLLSIVFSPTIGIAILVFLCNEEFYLRTTQTVHRIYTLSAPTLGHCGASSLGTHVFTPIVVVVELALGMVFTLL